MNSTPNDKDAILFTRLILTFQSAAMQQLGKIANPITGKIERDLEQASYSIDTLAMIQNKCKGNLSDDEDRLLEVIVSELKLNYVDEIGKPDPTTEQDKPETGEEEQTQPTEDKPESDTEN